MALTLTVTGQGTEILLNTHNFWQGTEKSLLPIFEEKGFINTLSMHQQLRWEHLIVSVVFTTPDDKFVFHPAFVLSELPRRNSNKPGYKTSSTNATIQRMSVVFLLVMALKTVLHFRDSWRWADLSGLTFPKGSYRKEGTHRPPHIIRDNFKKAAHTNTWILSKHKTSNQHINCTYTSLPGNKVCKNA